MSDMDYGMDILTLVDESGVEHEFEVANTMEENGKRYMALVPVFDGSEELLEDDGELVVLQVVEEGEEGEYLEAIEDEDEFNRISAIFMKNLEEEYDFIDEDAEK
ncbi:MAG: DUF1292 domain-containing protein [Oscillospiraceae bacterium]